MKRALSALLAALAVASVLPLLSSRARGDEPKPDEQKPAVDNGVEDQLLDSHEELVFEVERALDDYRVGVTQMSPDRVLAAFAEDFKGDVIFEAPDTKVEAVGLATVSARGVAPIDRAHLGEAVDRFFSGVDVVTHYVTKVAEAKKQGEFIDATVKHSLQARRGDGLIHIQERHSTRLKDGKIVADRRLSSRQVETKRPVFQDATAARGLAIAPNFDCHYCNYRDFFNHGCGGIALGDFDGDGLVDIFVTGSVRSHLFRNKGDGTFEDVTEKAGLKGAAGNGALWFDYDGDGKPDLLVTRYCSPDAKHKRCSLSREGWCEGKGCAVQLYRNKGDGTFENVTEKAGLNCTGGALGACVADIDKDGNLDLFVGRYGWMPSTVPSEAVGFFDRPFVFPLPSLLNADNAPPHLLFRNKGDGTFEEIGKKAGVGDTGWNLACCFLDVDGDGYPDLYAVNDYGKNVLYRNKGDGTFENASSRMGGEVGFGMGVARGDFMNDGKIGVYVAKMYSTAGNRIVDIMEERKRAPEIAALMRRFASGNTLFRANGDGTFADVTKTSGTASAGWAWGTTFADYMNEGRASIYCLNGYVTGESRRDL